MSLRKPSPNLKKILFFAVLSFTLLSTSGVLLAKGHDSLGNAFAFVFVLSALGLFYYLARVILFPIFNVVFNWLNRSGWK